MGSNMMIAAGATLVAASAALGVLERIAKGPLSGAPKLETSPASLRSAARLAYAYTKENRLPIAGAAERRCGSDGPVTWFENSILRTVPVSATCCKTGKRQMLRSFARMHMRAEGGGLTERADGEMAYSDPTISARHFRSYIRWARSLW